MPQNCDGVRVFKGIGSINRKGQKVKVQSTWQLGRSLWKHMREPGEPLHLAGLDAQAPGVKADLPKGFFKHCHVFGSSCAQPSRGMKLNIHVIACVKLDAEAAFQDQAKTSSPCTCRRARLHLI